MKYSINKPVFLIFCMLLFSGAIILQSCDQPSGITFTDNDEQKKENFETTPFNSQSLPSLKSNNTLAFDSFEQFGKFMNEFGEAVNIKPDKWVEQKLGFSSSLQRAQNEGRFAAESLNGSGTEKSRNELVPDPWFASVLSEDGLIEVEGTVFQISDNYTIIYEDWNAYNSYSKNIDVSANRTVNERNIVKNSELEKVNDSVYLFSLEEHEDEFVIIDPGPGDGGGGGGSWCCPSERTATYRSGGKDGRLKGKSWDINYYLYSSFGTKSKHQRRGPLGIGWVARTADQLWLDAEASYKYPEKTLGITSLSATLHADLYGVATSAINNLVNDAISLPTGNSLVRILVDATSNVPLYEIEIYKNTSNSFKVGGEVITTPPISLTAPSGNIPPANTIKVVVDRATAIVGWPGIINSGATKFDVQYIDGYHKLQHDGHVREFQTRKGSPN